MQEDSDPFLDEIQYCRCNTPQCLYVRTCALRSVSTRTVPARINRLHVAQIHRPLQDHHTDLCNLSTSL